MKMKVLALVMGIAVAAGMSGNALASGMDNAARSRLDSMAATTDPYAYYSSSGAHVGLGSFSFRMNNSRVSDVFTYSPPSVNSSCNGWDIFAGSFSIISADRILATLRSMASAVPMVAFRMAMAWLSQQLESITSKIFDGLIDMNKDFQNGCQLQETLMEGFNPKDMSFNTLLGEMGDATGSAMNSLTAQFKGVFSKTEDTAETVKEPGLVNRGVLERIAANDDRFLARNWVWEVLKLRDVQNGGNGATSSDLAVDLISMIGYKQMCVRADDSSGCLTRAQIEDLDADKKETAKIEWIPVNPTLSFSDFVNGQIDENNQVVRSENILVCQDGNSDPPCLVMVEQRRSAPLRGMVKTVQEIFLGPNNAHNTGIIGRAAMNLEPTAAELRILTASGQYGRMLMEIRKMYGQETARQFAVRNTKAIANEVAFGLLTEMMRELETNMSMSGGNPSLVTAKETVSNAMMRAMEEYDLIAKSEETRENLEEMRKALRMDGPLAARQ